MTAGRSVSPATAGTVDASLSNNVAKETHCTVRALTHPCPNAIQCGRYCCHPCDDRIGGQQCCLIWQPWPTRHRLRLVTLPVILVCDKSSRCASLRHRDARPYCDEKSGERQTKRPAAPHLCSPRVLLLTCTDEEGGSLNRPDRSASRSAAVQCSAPRAFCKHLG